MRVNRRKWSLPPNKICNFPSASWQKFRNPSFSVCCFFFSIFAIFAKRKSRTSFSDLQRQLNHCTTTTIVNLIPFQVPSKNRHKCQLSRYGELVFSTSRTGEISVEGGKEISYFNLTHYPLTVHCRRSCDCPVTLSLPCCSNIHSGGVVARTKHKRVEGEYR